MNLYRVLQHKTGGPQIPITPSCFIDGATDCSATPESSAVSTTLTATSVIAEASSAAPAPAAGCMTTVTVALAGPREVVVRGGVGRFPESADTTALVGLGSFRM